MTLRELLARTNFDDMVPFIRETDRSDDVCYLKQAYDILLHTSPSEDGCENVGITIYKSPEGNIYYNAPLLEGCIWGTYIQCHGLQNKDTEHHADIINLVNSNARLIHYTEVFKAIYFFRLLQKFAEIRLLLAEKLRTNVAIQPNIASHKSLAITHNENMICTLKYTGTMLKCIFVDGQTFDVDDTKPLDIADAIIGYIAEIIK